MNLYRENRIDQAYELTSDEVLDQFAVSPLFNIPAYRFETALRRFITNADGLNSVWEPDGDIEAVMNRAHQRSLVRRWYDGLLATETDQP